MSAEKQKITQFAQFYKAFGGSPGGFNHDGYAYLSREKCLKYCTHPEGYQFVVDHLNATGVINAPKGIVVLDWEPYRAKWREAMDVPPRTIVDDDGKNPPPPKYEE